VTTIVSISWAKAALLEPIAAINATADAPSLKLAVKFVFNTYSLPGGCHWRLYARFFRQRRFRGFPYNAGCPALTPVSINADTGSTEPYVDPACRHKVRHG
jgi:hypothetical protein